MGQGDEKKPGSIAGGLQFQAGVDAPLATPPRSTYSEVLEGRRGLVMATSFGEQLRLAREARGITLRQISEHTRISVRYLEAIETGEYKRLPGGIFNRSFIKAYAKHIGFDEKEAIEGYTRTAREQGDSPDEVISTPYQPRVYTDPGSSRSPLVTWLLTFLILAILSLGAYAVRHWYIRWRAPKAGNGVVSNVTPGETSPNAAAGKNGPATATPRVNAAAPAGFNVQVTARREKVWVRAYVDDDPKAVLANNLDVGETKEFKPQQRLRIQAAKDKLSSLEVSVNGRLVKVPPDNKGILAEVTISKEDYEKFSQ